MRLCCKSKKWGQRFFGNMSSNEGKPKPDEHPDFLFHEKIDMIENCMQNSSSVENIILGIENLEVLSERLRSGLP